MYPEISKFIAYYRKWIKTAELIRKASRGKFSLGLWFSKTYFSQENLQKPLLTLEKDPDKIDSFHTYSAIEISEKKSQFMSDPENLKKAFLNRKGE